MSKIALIVHTPPKGSPLIEPIAETAALADVVLPTRFGRSGKGHSDKEVPISLSPDCASAFQGGTLRPLAWLEEILSDLEVTQVWVAGEPLRLVVQTALDANALGYPTCVFRDTMGHCDSATIMRLESAGVVIGGLDD